MVERWTFNRRPRRRRRLCARRRRGRPSVLRSLAAGAGPAASARRRSRRGAIPFGLAALPRARPGSVPRQSPGSRPIGARASCCAPQESPDRSLAPTRSLSRANREPTPRGSALLLPPQPVAPSMSAIGTGSANARRLWRCPADITPRQRLAGATGCAGPRYSRPPSRRRSRCRPIQSDSPPRRSPTEPRYPGPVARGEANGTSAWRLNPSS